MPILYFSDNIVLIYLLTVVRVAPVVFVTLRYHHLTGTGDKWDSHSQADSLERV